MQYLKEYYDPSLDHHEVSVWELIYLILFRPAEGFAYIKGHENNLALYNIFLIGVACSSIFYIIFFASTGSLTHNLWFLIPTALFAAMMMLLSTAVYHLAAELFAKRGNATDMVLIVSLAQLPNFFLVFLYGFGLIDSVTESIGTLLGFGVMLWSFLIALRGITILYEISKLKAIFIIALPALVLMAMLFIVLIAGFSYFIMTMEDMINGVVNSPLLPGLEQ